MIGASAHSSRCAQHVREFISHWMECLDNFTLHALLPGGTILNSTLAQDAFQEYACMTVWLYVPLIHYELVAILLKPPKNNCGGRGITKDLNVQPVVTTASWVSRLSPAPSRHKPNEQAASSWTWRASWLTRTLTQCETLGDIESWCHEAVKREYVWNVGRAP